jgi:hypothetical protein
VGERFRIWCGGVLAADGWEWHWQVSDTELRAYDRRISAPGVVARGWQPSWSAALEDAARYRRHVIDERPDLTWS